MIRTLEQFAQQMNNGKRFRLKLNIIGIETMPSRRRAAVIVPAGEIIRVVGQPVAGPAQRQMIDIVWGNHTITVFAQDIEEHTTAVRPTRAK